MRGDKECSFSCVTRFDRVCSKVPESDARPVAKTVCTIRCTLAAATGHAGVFIMCTVVSAQRLCRTVEELSLQATATDIIQPDGGHASLSEVRVAVGPRLRAARVNKDDPLLTHTSSNSNYATVYS